MKLTKEQTFAQCRELYRREGYTEEHDFPGEYLLMINPSTMDKVRLYYGSYEALEYR